jgi:hypothetical protein
MSEFKSILKSEGGNLIRLLWFREPFSSNLSVCPKSNFGVINYLLTVVSLPENVYRLDSQNPFNDSDKVPVSIYWDKEFAPCKLIMDWEKGSTFLDQFQFIEAIAFHYICLYKANSFSDYKQTQKILSNKHTSLKSKLEQIWKHIKKQDFNQNIDFLGEAEKLRKIRNEIAHNITPLVFPYDDRYYLHSDPELLSRIKASFVTVFMVLSRAYKDMQFKKLYLWRYEIQKCFHIEIKADGSLMYLEENI